MFCEKRTKTDKAKVVNNGNRQNLSMSGRNGTSQVCSLNAEGHMVTAAQIMIPFKDVNAR